MLKTNYRKSFKARLENLEDRRFLSVNVAEFKVSEPAAVMGDLNQDGQFGSDDLVIAFQAGEYDDGIPQNSTLEEGDFNGDGDFDSSDLVDALQAGNYQDSSIAAQAGKSENHRVVQRDLQEFLDAQGTLFPPTAPSQTPVGFIFNNNPDINGDGVNEGTPYKMYVDYFGMLGRDSAYEGLLGPESVSGKVTERPLGNGLSEVTASIETKGALIWVTENDADIFTGPTVLGYREAELLADPSLEAARADVKFSVKFLIDEGAALPDLIEPAIAGQFQSFQFVVNATGPLPTGEADFGVPDGTTGRLTWGKPGRWIDGSSPANPNASNGAASLFPNDEFHLGPIGPRP